MLCYYWYTSFRLSWLMKFFFVHLGRFGNTSIHEDFKLVIRKHIFSYDNRQSCSWIKTSLWNLTWIQNGWSFNIIHIINVGKYEQTQINEDKMRIIIDSLLLVAFFQFQYDYILWHKYVLFTNILDSFVSCIINPQLQYPRCSCAIVKSHSYLW